MLNELRTFLKAAPSDRLFAFEARSERTMEEMDLRLVGTQQREVMDLLREEGFDPSDFEWQTWTVDELRGDYSAIAFRYTVSKLVHVDSDFYFQFEKYRSKYSPAHQLRTKIESWDRLIDRKKHLRDWLFNLRLELEGGKQETAIDNLRSAERDSDKSTQAEPLLPKAFVSHSTQDHAFVERFATDLRAHGVDAWYSGWEIKPGDSIRGKIEEGLEGCEFFIIVLSKNSISRPWVQTELDAATIRKLSGKVRKIIPVKIEVCGDLPPTLSALCWEDFSDQPYESALKRVLDSIFGVYVRPPLGKQPSLPAPAPDLSRITGPPDQKSQRSRTNFPIHYRALGKLAEQLRREGFGAQTDLFNGQIGLIVGPEGLDSTRMPPNDIALFFPLWELNYDANRPLVEARRFHDIFENRPRNWQFNKPYSSEQNRDLEPSRQQGAIQAGEDAKRRYIVEREFSAWTRSNRNNPNKHFLVRYGFHVFAVVEPALGPIEEEFITFDMDAREYETNRRTFVESVRLCTPEDISLPPY